MIRTLPGDISGPEALTTPHSLIASKTTRMLHTVHILAFPEPRFVNLGFSGNPDIRMSGNADIRLSGYPVARLSDYPDFRISGNPHKSNFDELARKWSFCQ